MSTAEGNVEKELMQQKQQPGFVDAQQQQLQQLQRLQDESGLTNSPLTALDGHRVAGKTAFAFDVNVCNVCSVCDRKVLLRSIKKTHPFFCLILIHFLYLE